MARQTGEEGKAAARRDLLRLAGLGAVAGAAAVAAPAATARAAEVPPAGRSGYRETEHVRTYYRLARF